MELITISKAKNILNEIEADQVIILAWKKGSNDVHYATYGRDKEHCAQASKGVQNLIKIFNFGMRKVLAFIDSKEGEKE